MDRIVKADVAQGTTRTWSEDDCSPGEPVFVAAPHADAEDEGVLLSVVFDARRETSFLLMLDARTLKELARAEGPASHPVRLPRPVRPGLAPEAVRTGRP